MIRRDYRASNYSPLNQITAHNVKGPPPRLVVGDERRRNESARADRPQRRRLSQQRRQHAAGDRRQDRRVDLGAPIRHRRNGGRDARHLDLRRQDLCRDQQRASLRLRCANRQDRLGDRHRRPIERATTRPAAGRSSPRAKSSRGSARCQTYREEKCFISAYDAATGKQLWRFNTIAQTGEPGGDTWGKLPNLFRAGTESWITGSYDPALNLTFWGTAQAKPWMPISRGMSPNDDALYTQFDGGARCRYRQAGLALSARARRSARSRRRLRARARRSTAARICCSRSARTASCGSSIGRPANISATRRRCFRMSGLAFDSKTGRPFYRPDIIEQQQFGAWVQACPSTEGGHNWPASSYHQPPIS